MSYDGKADGDNDLPFVPEIVVVGDAKRPKRLLNAIYEGYGEEMMPIVDHGKCTGCGQYVDVCPVDAIIIIDVERLKEELAGSPNGFAHRSHMVVAIQDDLCEECGFCSAECRVKAIRIPFPLYEE
jgi:NAD-dependent dihydropyrimidine dehydrogenase PreA subunit